MEKRAYSIKVGQRGFDDPQMTTIPGELNITPRSKKLLLISGGFTGTVPSYTGNFADELASEYTTYTTEIRNRGYACVDLCAKNLVQIEEFLKKETGCEEVVHVGHSMAMSVIARAKELGSTSVAVYGMGAYPSYGDTKAISADLEKKGFVQSFWDLASKVNYGPIGFPLKNHQFSEPIRFAIPLNDELLNTANPIVLERFKKYFTSNAASSVIEFEGRNHCFNYTPFDLDEFNKDEPSSLVNDVLNFVQSI